MYVLLPRPHAQLARKRQMSVVVTAAVKDAAGETLTPSERRIAQLAAAGQSNRDIARALYVTPKTVEVHLTSVYRKLGIRSRGGLSSAL